MIFKTYFFAFFYFFLQIGESLKCYSCASENLQENFQTRHRKPPGNLIGIPKIFDNNCDLDFWILRSKAEVDCNTACYKWQQIVNNSGVYSYMTVRACYNNLFGISPSPIDEASCNSNVKYLDCLPEANLIEILEQYATNLKQKVEVRTKKLAEENKKSDIFLYRMLPRQVSDKLKTGQGVESEFFDSVTVFFSDVVSFTTLVEKCTLLQVVNLLNDLCSTFDIVIDEHSCLKVETIGDGYLCVSSLPIRNDNIHVKDIAEISFEFLQVIKTFRIPHLPSERINIRIEAHTGSYVAGVVGLTIPRYCLFGDTINIASKMESNEKPRKIHISSITNNYLIKIVGFDQNNRSYLTQTRGEVIIKGKGLMKTFFLLTEDDDYETNERN